MQKLKPAGPVGPALTPEETRRLRVPTGTLRADTTKQRPNGAGQVRYYYADRPFACRSCGKEEVWLAESQKHWYEDCRGDILAVAILCRACRKGT